VIENTVEILLVGDCLKDRTTYSRYLLQDQQYTYSILEADTGKKGLQLCYQKFPDVIVMDDLLPDIDGVEFLTSLKTQLSKTNLPIIILTSLGNEQIALQAMNSGAAYCLVKKTITPVCFIQALQKVLEKTDITQKLQESEERFHATFNQTSVGIAHVGLNGRCLRVNQKLCEILGYTNEELKQLTLEEITYPNDLTVDWEYIHQLLVGELQTYQLEKRYIRKDNSYVWINLSVSVVRTSFGEPYLNYVVQNINALKQVQQAYEQLETRVNSRTLELEQVNKELQTALEELQITQEELHRQNEELITSRQVIERERQRYQDLFEFAPEGYLVTDISGNIREANCTAANLLATSRQHLIGKPFIVFIADQQRKTFHTRLAKLRYMQEWEVYLKSGSGKLFPTMVTVASMNDQKGQRVGLRWLLHDISARKQMHQQLQAAYNQLERRVEERTSELSQANMRLQQEIAKHKQSEAQVAFQASLIDQVRNAVIATDLEGKITYWNQFAQQLYHFTPEDIGKFILDVIIPTDQQETTKQIMPSIQATGVWAGELELQRRDGSVFPAYAVNTLVRDQNGNPCGIVGVSTDITERKQAEMIRHQMAQELQSLYDNAPCGYVSLDAEGRVIRINETKLKMLGYSRQEIIGKKITDFYTPESIPIFEKHYLLFKQQSMVKDLELQILRKDGSILPISVSTTAIYDEAGNYLMSNSIAVDISDRKQAQEKIKEQAALLNVASDAIFVRNLEHEVLFWNQAAESLYGWQTTEVLGKKATELFSEEIVTQVDEALNVAVQQGKWEGELQHTTKDGKKVVVLSRWTLLRDNTGQPKSLLTVNTDITEKKQLEAQFYRIQRLESLGTLASGIAHDLNNMLSPILAVAQLLPLKLPNLDEKNQELLKILEDSSKRGAQLVKQITSFAQGAEGKLVPLQLKNLILEVEGIVNSTFPKSIEIFTSLGEDLWTVSVDQTQIHQVLMNLCVNARDAMPQGGTLSISAENFLVDHNYARMNLEAKEGPYVVITVSDTGYGISKEVVERIFEPFFTTKEQGKGTGLGLATVLGIIKNHGGFVRVHSEVGEGSEFRVYLPAIEDEVAKQEEAENYQIDRGNNELILVVDDEAFIREMTKNSLEQYNYRVLTASDAVDAFSLYTLHKNEISVVLIDIQMPTIDGLNAIRILQQIDSSIKIIAISGLASNRKLLEASGIQVQAFLLKPYTIKELLNTIQAKLMIC
jgi:PAS domain S-box-containing protein